MKGADFSGFSAIVHPALGNGKHRAAKKNGAAPKRSGGSGPRTEARPASQPSTAPFATIDAGPINAPMWPVHSAVWFQPELAPSIPAWSSLAIERQSRIPAPDFLYSEPTPYNRAESRNDSRDALLPVAAPELPQTDLAPLGWDPRAVCRNGKEGSE